MKKLLILVFISGLCLAGIALYQYRSFHDGKLHVVFCDVGQGDGILVRSPKGKTILIDGGPSDAILSCLAAHAPFWERTIDLMLLSHPHADHLLGLISVLDRYAVLSFGTEKLMNTTAEFTALQEALRGSNTKRQFLYAGDRFRLRDGVEIVVLGPDAAFLNSTSPNGKITDRKEFASLNLLITYGTFRVLLTGDSQTEQIRKSLTQLTDTSISVLQVPHHGSRFGLDDGIVQKIRPQLAVISVGKNSYGHPTRQILQLLKQYDIQTVRTDMVGDVEIVSDGKSFAVKK